jgi:hypothetical protein
VRSWLLSGALVEAGPGAGTGRIIDHTAAAAGISEPVRTIRRSASGAALAFVRTSVGAPAVLRVAGAGWPGDPRRGLEALRSLGDRPQVPKALDAGLVDGAAWTLETRLAGVRPTRLDRVTADAGSLFAASLPSASGPPRSFDRDLSRVADLLWDRADGVRVVAERAGTLARDVPGVMRHGDFWIGNLLVRAGALSGVVDWDNWAPDGAPGADILHLYGTDLALRSRRELGEIWIKRPWSSEEFRTFSATYWSSFDAAPTGEVLLLAAIAWWAAAIAGTLERVPTRSHDERWLVTNVDRVVELVPRL